MGHGVYYSEVTERKQRRSIQRRKKALVAFLGLTAVVGGGSYGVTTWLAARDSITTLTDAIGPAAPSSSAARPHAPTKRPRQKPAPGPSPATLGAVRQQFRPSPTPTPSSTLTDDQIAAVQVGHLLERTPGMSAASSAVTVTDETAADGSLIRVVSAPRDLAGKWGSLWAADSGQSVGTARCTRNFRINGGSFAEVRPGMLLCWRTSAARSVVTVATNERDRPSAAASVAVVDREWSRIR